MSKQEPVPIPVSPVKYPVIWWYCAVTKEELSQVTLKLDKITDPFELRERLRQELEALMAECRGQKIGRKK